jgi:hypothetical protein
MEQFNPSQELENVRKAPKAERKEKLAEFKEDLARQQQGLAKVQELMIAVVRENPDMQLPELMEEVERLSVAVGMHDNQKRVAETVLQQYVEKHHAVREIRQQFQEDRELYHALFGLYPRGKIEIIEGPMTLYVRCYDLGDYTLIHSQKFLDTRNWSNEDEKQAKMSGGVSIGTSLIPGLGGTIIAENASKFGAGNSVLHTDGTSEQRYGFDHASENEKQRSRAIHEHEEQHAIKRLFAEPIRKIKFNGPEGYFSTDEDREKYFRWLRDTGEEHARDEILAYFKDGTPGETAVSFLMKPEHEGGLYDYFAGERKEAVDLMRGNQDPVTYLLAGDQGFSMEEKINLLKILHKVFTEEYEQLLKEGVAACERLVASGWSKDRVIGLLIHEPLSNWKNVVGRLLKAKK